MLGVVNVTVPHLRSKFVAVGNGEVRRGAMHSKLARWGASPRTLLLLNVGVNSKMTKGGGLLPFPATAEVDDQFSKENAFFVFHVHFSSSVALQ